MIRSLAGTTALVTGASGGIGSAVARRLARAGVRLILSGRNRAALGALARELDGAATSPEASGPTLVVPADLSTAAGARGLVEEVCDAVDCLDILVNNAGVALTAALAETTDEQMDLHYAVNVRAPFILSRGFLPLLRRSKDPRIVNIASVVAHKGYARQGAYSAAKHALLGLSKVAAREFAEAGVLVHVISPGAVAGDMVRDMRPDIDPDALIQPEDIAEVLMFLVQLAGQATIDEIRVRRRSSEPFA